MGYEVIFYHKNKDKSTGEYKDNGSFKKRIGDPYEDTSLENLASLILKQLARRDVWVENVEIFEITKKKISFKETKSGIVIKNKKFILDDNFEISIQHEEENSEPVIENTNSNSSQVLNKKPIATDRPIRRMVYLPEPQQHSKVAKEGIRLTHNKIYEVFKIEDHPNGVTQIFTIIDDSNSEKRISDDYFVPEGMASIDDSPENSSDGLNWHGVINTNIPSVR